MCFVLLFSCLYHWINQNIITLPYRILFFEVVCLHAGEGSDTYFALCCLKMRILPLARTKFTLACLPYSLFSYWKRCAQWAEFHPHKLPGQMVNYHADIAYLSHSWIYLLSLEYFIKCVLPTEYVTPGAHPKIILEWRLSTLPNGLSIAGK